jgi:ribose transport system permease protein
MDVEKTKNTGVLQRLKYEGGLGLRPPTLEAAKRSSGARAARVGAIFTRKPEFWLLCVLVAICSTFGVATPSHFLTLFEFRSVTSSASVLLVLAAGETLVIVTSGIDLSVGSVLVFSGFASAKVMAHGASAAAVISNDSVFLILVGGAAAALAGLCWGLVNGFLIARARVPPLIVTLGTLSAALGLTYILTGGVDISAVPQNFQNLMSFGTIAGIPWLVLIAAGIALIVGIVLAKTRFGRYLIAVGSNAEAARRAGISVERQLVIVYAVQGLLSGIAGFLALGYFGTTAIAGHGTDNLNAIAAVIIGGTSLFGGSGSMIGTTIGVLIPTVLASGFVLVGANSYWQQIAVGAVLVGAVYFDQIQRRRRSL